MSLMGSMVGTMMGRLVMPAAAVGSVGAYKTGALDGMSIPGMASAPSHYEMQARVSSVDQTCHLRFREKGQLRQTEALDCTRAVDLLRQPKFVGYSLHKSELVTYHYYSMDGRSTLSGTLTSARDAAGRPYRRNDVINIRVSSSNPAQSEVI